jgi:zinc protease
MKEALVALWKNGQFEANTYSSVGDEDALPDGAIIVSLKRFLAEGPTTAEQADAVSSLLGSLPRQLETNEGAAAVMGEIELYELGLDYLERYPDIVRALTREQVTETARRWIDTQRLVTAIAGPPRS